MAQVERGETYLKALGFGNVRLRVHGQVARLEVDVRDFPALLLQKEEIVRYLKETGYTYITLDLEGFRSGSMDVGSTTR